MFLKITHGETNLQHDFFFLKRPEKKIDTRKSRKGVSRNAKNPVKMEQTRNKDDALRTKHETKHRRKDGSKNQRLHFVFKKLTTEIFEFVWAKERYGDERRRKKRRMRSRTKEREEK